MIFLSSLDDILVFFLLLSVVVSADFRPVKREERRGG